MVVFHWIRPGQVPEEPQPEGLDPFRDWQAACSAPNRLICSVSGVRDPNHPWHQNWSDSGISGFRTHFYAPRSCGAAAELQ